MWSLPGAAPLLRDWGPGLPPGSKPRGRHAVPPSLACHVGRFIPPFLFRSSFIPSSRFLPPPPRAVCALQDLGGYSSPLPAESHCPHPAGLCLVPGISERCVDSSALTTQSSCFPASLSEQGACSCLSTQPASGQGSQSALFSCSGWFPRSASLKRVFTAIFNVSRPS